MRRSTILASLSGASCLIFVCAQSAGAVSFPCPPGTLVRDCPDAIRQAAAEARAAAATEKGETLVRRAANEKALGAADNVGSASTFRDTLSRFFVTLGLGTAKQEEGDLTLLFNPDFLNLGTQNPLSPKLVVHSPEVLPQLVEAHPEDGRADFKEGLEGSLKDLDDVEFSLTWSRKGDHFGAYMPGNLFDEAVATAVGDGLSGRAYDELKALSSSLELPIERLRELDSQLDSQYAENLEKAANQDAQEDLDSFARLDDLLARVDFDKLATLVTNQPQILVTGQYRARGGTAGPDSWGLKATWEKGFVNINSLRKGSGCQGTVSLGCFQAYVQRSDVKANLDGSSRIAFSLEYAASEVFDFASPSLRTPFHLDRATKTIASFTAGRRIAALGLGADGGTRIDLQAAYEDVSGDETKNNRLVATATFSQRLTAAPSGKSGSVASLSFVYANKPEYRGEVSKEVSARFGIKWKVDDGE